MDGPGRVRRGDQLLPGDRGLLRRAGAAGRRGLGHAGRGDRRLQHGGGAEVHRGAAAEPVAGGQGRRGVEADRPLVVGQARVTASLYGLTPEAGAWSPRSPSSSSVFTWRTSRTPSARSRPCPINSSSVVRPINNAET